MEHHYPILTETLEYAYGQVLISPASKNWGRGKEKTNLLNLAMMAQFLENMGENRRDFLRDFDYNIEGTKTHNQENGLILRNSFGESFNLDGVITRRKDGKRIVTLLHKMPMSEINKNAKNYSNNHLGEIGRVLSSDPDTNILFCDLIPTLNFKLLGNGEITWMQTNHACLEDLDGTGKSRILSSPLSDNAIRQTIACSNRYNIAGARKGKNTVASFVQDFTNSDEKIRFVDRNFDLATEKLLDVTIGGRKQFRT